MPIIINTPKVSECHVSTNALPDDTAHVGATNVPYHLSSIVNVNIYTHVSYP